MSRLADIPDDRYECPGCGAGFKRRSERHEHRLDECPETLPEGAAKCSCEGDAEPDKNAVHDPNTGRQREMFICPCCGESVSGGGQFA